MHVTIYLFCYLCIYYMLVLFFCYHSQTISAVLSQRTCKAHELASHEGKCLVSTRKQISDIGHEQGKGMLHCAMYHIQYRVTVSCM